MLETTWFPINAANVGFGIFRQKPDRPPVKPAQYVEVQMGLLKNPMQQKEMHCDARGIFEKSRVSN